MDIKKHSQKGLVFIINLLIVVLIAFGIKEASAKKDLSVENKEPETIYPVAESVAQSQSDIAAYRENKLRDLSNTTEALAKNGQEATAADSQTQAAPKTAAPTAAAAAPKTAKTAKTSSTSSSATKDAAQSKTTASAPTPAKTTASASTPAKTTASASTPAPAPKPAPAPSATTKTS